MRTARLITIASLAIALHANAQITAGEVPSGGTALDQNINLILSAPFTADSAGLEIDCDDFPDIMAVLISGAPPIDAPNVAMLRMIDDDLEILANGTTFSSRPQYFNQGEPLSPAVGFDWYTDDVVQLGDFGGFSATGPVAVNNLYVAVRRAGQVGWIQLSFLLNNSLSVSLQVHSALSFCGLPTGVEESASGRLRLAPSVTHGEPILVGADERWLAIDVLDGAGRLVARHVDDALFIPAPEVPGAYLVRAWPAHGAPVVGRVVRY